MLELYEEAIHLYQRIGDQSGEAARCFNLGHAYKNIDAILDFDRAEARYRRSLDLRPAHDNLSRAQCLVQLGTVALRRLEDGEKSSSPSDVLDAYFASAIDFYKQALATVPPDAVDGIAVIRNQLAAVYSRSANHLHLAIEQLREVIRCCEVTGDQKMAGGARNNLAWTFFNAGRFAEAREFAQSALSILESSPIPDRAVIRSVLSCLRAAEEGLGAAAPSPG